MISSANPSVSLAVRGGFTLITAAQLRAARALAGIDQRELAERSDLSVPTIQRMEASEGVIRGNVDSLMKLIGALDPLASCSLETMRRAMKAAAAFASSDRGFYKYQSYSAAVMILRRRCVSMRLVSR